MDLKNKRVLVTGATGGIGQRIVERLDARGAVVIPAGRDVEGLKRLGNRAHGPEHNVCSIAADLTTPEGRDTVFNHISAAGCGLDILVNCAGINAFQSFSSMTENGIERLIAVNLTAPILLTRRLLPLLEKKEKTHIVNVGSTFGALGFPGYTGYCATKFGLRGFSEALRRELAASNIKVSYLAPRATRTGMNTDTVYLMNEALGVVMDDPLWVAERLIDVLERGKSVDRYLGWPEKLFVKINALLPKLVDRSISKQLSSIQRYTGQSKPARGECPQDPIRDLV